MIRTAATSGFAKFVSIGSGLTLIMDLAQPLWPFATGATILFLLLFLFSFGISLFPQARTVSVKFSGLFFICFLLSSGTLVMQSLTPEGQDKGALASRFDAVSSIQNQLMEISNSNREIANNTRDTAESVRVISEVTKRETSENPRKEMANMGVSWTREGFWEAVDTGDTTIIDLFLKGGLEIEHDELFSKLIFHSQNQKSVEFFVKNGFIPDVDICSLDHVLLSHNGYKKNIYDRVIEAQNKDETLKSLIGMCGEEVILSAIMSRKDELKEYMKSYSSRTESCVGNVKAQMTSEEIMFQIFKPTVVITDSGIAIVRMYLDGSEATVQPGSSGVWDGREVVFNPSSDDHLIAMSGFRAGALYYEQSLIDKHTLTACGD